MRGRKWAQHQHCWLANFAWKEGPCEGRMERAHLIPQQLLKREGHGDLCSDPRTWVPACRMHHFSWDNYRGLEVPRESLPEAFLSLLDDIGLSWYLDRRYKV